MMLFTIWECANPKQWVNIRMVRDAYMALILWRKRGKLMPLWNDSLACAAWFALTIEFSFLSSPVEQVGISRPPGRERIETNESPRGQV